MEGGLEGWEGDPEEAGAEFGEERRRGWFWRLLGRAGRSQRSPGKEGEDLSFWQGLSGSFLTFYTFFLCPFGLSTHPPCPTSSFPACLPVIPYPPPFPYSGTPIPYRHPPYMFSRIGGLSFGSIKTSWLTDSPGKWCLGKKGFRGSSWGLPVSTMGQSTADPTGFRIPQPTPRGPDLPWPAYLRRAGLPGLLLALVAERGELTLCSGLLLSPPPPLLLCGLSPRHHSRPDNAPSTCTSPYVAVRTGSGQSLGQAAGGGPSLLALCGV